MEMGRGTGLLYAQGDAFLARLLVSISTVELPYVKEHVAFIETYVIGWA